MTDAYWVIQTLGFATGTVLFVLLTALTWKAERLAREPYEGTRCSALGLLWNVGNLVKYVVLLMGFEYVSMPCRLAEILAWTATATLPTAFLVMLQPAQLVRPWQPRLSRWFRFVSYVNAIWLTVGFFAAGLVLNFPSHFFTFMRLSAYNLVFHVVAGVLVFRGASQRTPARSSYSRTVMLVVAGLALSLMLILHLPLPRSLAMVLDTLAEQVSIPLALVSFTYLARFRFADVFVKRSLTILAAVIMASIYALFIVEPLVVAIRTLVPHGRAASVVVATLLWCGLLLLFPPFARAVSRATDRWLFQRPDYRRLAQTISQEIEPLENERELFTLAEQQIQTALDVAAARVISRAEVQTLGDEIEPVASDLMPLRADHPARRLLGEPEVEVLIPIRANGTTIDFLAIAPGERGRKLLSDELTFLLTLAERIGRKIESLQFERERREQQLHEARLRHLLTEAQLKALRAQVNPHFLFNTLNTIIDLIGSNPEKAEIMTERLAEVFRYVLARSDRNLIAVSEEFEFLHTYLEIEQARFGDRLRVELAVDPAIAAESIPSLILQPLVENAIKHGLAPKLGGGALRIRAVDEGAFMRLVVEDDGVGWAESKKAEGGKQKADEGSVNLLLGVVGQNHLNSTSNRSPSYGGVGLRNVTERLRTLYGDRAEVNIRSEAGQGTCVSILIPRNETQNLDHRRRSVGAISIAEVAERSS